MNCELCKLIYAVRNNDNSTLLDDPRAFTTTIKATMNLSMGCCHNIDHIYNYGFARGLLHELEILATITEPKIVRHKMTNRGTPLVEQVLSDME